MRIKAPAPTAQTVTRHHRSQGWTSRARVFYAFSLHFESAIRTRMPDPPAPPHAQAAGRRRQSSPQR